MTQIDKFKYKEIYISSVKGHSTYIDLNSGQVVLIKELDDFIKDYIGKEIEIYTSYYDYDKEYKDYVEKYKYSSINEHTDFEGRYNISEIILDIDKKGKTYNHLLINLIDTIEFIKDEFSVDIANIKPWFSGTGFHIYIPNVFNFKPSSILSFQTSSKIKLLFPHCDVFSAIPYNGIMRYKHSFNKKSGLFKIPLSMDEILSMDMENILNLAKQPRLDF